MPLFVWSILTYAWLLLLVLPALTAGLTALLLERQFPGTFHFFAPESGGSAVLYQHVFWFFGHPEVYIMILPAFGIISEILPVFSRKPIFGYKAIAFSTIAIGFFSLLVWGHHMFTVGLLDAAQHLVHARVDGDRRADRDQDPELARDALARQHLVRHADAVLAGFLSVFVFGGLTGIYLAAFPVDWQLQDTYFVVAHFHYVLFGGAVFAIIGGLFYWWPKLFGRLLDERLGKLDVLARRSPAST